MLVRSNGGNLEGISEGLNRGSSKGSYNREDVGISDCFNVSITEGEVDGNEYSKEDRTKDG